MSNNVLQISDDVKRYIGGVIKNMQGYRGSNRLKSPGTQIDWTPELMAEYIKCRDDPIYFAETYFRVINQQNEFEPIKLFDYQKELILSCIDNKSTIAEMARQAGKALPLDTPIPTPYGWTTMGALIPGDTIFDEHGQPTQVTGTSEIFKNHKCFKITFDDGTHVIADADHIWTVNRASSRNTTKSHNKTTQELFEYGQPHKDSRNKLVSKWKIPLAGAVNYPKKEISVDPYTLGVWLGDGHTSSGSITCHKDDLFHYKEQIMFEFSVNNQKQNPNVYTGTLYTLVTKLKEYNLVGNKHIPRDYLINDIDTRVAILQGLMDTDGWVERGRNAIALSYNRSPQLIENVYELLVSLGFKVFRKEYPKTNSVRFYFQCDRQTFDVFRLPRKVKLQKEREIRPEYTQFRYIRNIEAVDSVPTKCITVENESHLFLCSNHFIPTHNSTAVTVLLCWFIIFNKNRLCAILANKEKTAIELLGRIKRAYEELPDWLQQGVITWNKTEIELENRSRIIAAATSNDNIRGFSVDFLFVDEAAFIDGWDDFWTSLSPTVSAKPHGRVCLVSTVNGLNHFYNYTNGARKGTNSWNLISCTWQDVPGRGEEWRKEALSLLNGDQERFEQEFCITGDTKVTVRDKITGKIKILAIEDLYDQVD